MFRSYWERAAKVTGERIADLSARPLPPSPEAVGRRPTVQPTAVVPVPAGRPAPAGSDEQLSALAGLITRALESADQLAAATRRRKGTKVASTESDATETAAGMTAAAGRRWRDADGVDRRPRRRAVAGRRAHRRCRPRPWPPSRDRGVRVVFATNNSAPTTDELVARLARIGIDADADDLVTSARVAASLLEPGERVHVLAEGGSASRRSADAGRRGRRLRRRATPPWSAGAATSTSPRWPPSSAVARETGRLIATNSDPTHPTPEGLLPGSGALLAAVATASGVEPVVAGKPNPPMVDYIRAARPGTDGGPRRWWSGDQPGTDGLLAERLGVPFVLVDSGVTPPGTPVDGCPVALRAHDFVSVGRPRLVAPRLLPSC